VPRFIARRFLCAEAGQGLPPFPAPLSPLAAFFLRYAPDLLLTNPITSSTIRGPASLAPTADRDRPGIVIAFPSESAITFSGIPTSELLRNEGAPQALQIVIPAGTYQRAFESAVYPSESSAPTPALPMPDGRRARMVWILTAGVLAASVGIALYLTRRPALAISAPAQALAQAPTIGAEPG
jgi:hypothetical protein